MLHVRATAETEAHLSLKYFARALCAPSQSPPRQQGAGGFESRTRPSATRSGPRPAEQPRPARDRARCAGQPTSGSRFPRHPCSGAVAAGNGAPPGSCGVGFRNGVGTRELTIEGDPACADVAPPGLFATLPRGGGQPIDLGLVLQQARDRFGRGMQDRCSRTSSPCVSCVRIAGTPPASLMTTGQPLAKASRIEDGMLSMSGVCT